MALRAGCDQARRDRARSSIGSSRDWGQLDILVNNAGINTMAHRVTIDEFPRDEWDRILAVDLTGLYEVSKAAARVMRAEARAGSSTSRRSPGSFRSRLQCAFVAAKAGVVNLTRAMAIELGPHGILVNGVAPGSTLTEGTRSFSTARMAHSARTSSACSTMFRSAGRARPTRSQSPCSSWPIPKTAYMNGHILTVDGGWTAGYDVISEVLHRALFGDESA